MFLLLGEDVIPTLMTLTLDIYMAYNKKRDGLVYSTEHGRMCPVCSKPEDKCSCAGDNEVAQGDGIVRVKRETKGRKGKGVSIVTGLPLTKPELKKMATELKARCGCGGTLKDGVIEIQGDKREMIVEILKKKGYQAKLAGG